MKIRIKGNSIRLRLSQTEISSFANNGKVSDAICFGNSTLFYQLVKAKSDQLSATFVENIISVEVPENLANKWVNTDQVGIEHRTDSLIILIEKDFQCLTERPDEDESDLFENPLSNHNC